MKNSSCNAWAIAATGLAVALMCSHAGAEDFQARAWSAGCAACHGTNGKGGNEVPALAGRSRADLLTVLKEFKADQRKTATIMHQHSKGYDDAQLERIADYFSRQSR